MNFFEKALSILEIINASGYEAYIVGGVVRDYLLKLDLNDIDIINGILVQEAHIGRDAESAKEHSLSVRKERLEKNRKESVDLTQKEKELRENIAKTKAGSL